MAIHCADIRNVFSSFGGYICGRMDRQRGKQGRRQTNTAFCCFNALRANNAQIYVNYFVCSVFLIVEKLTLVTSCTYF